MFKKNSKKMIRIMSIFIAVIMIIGMLPMNVLAKGYDYENDHKDLEIRFWEDEKPDLGFYIDATSKFVIEKTPEPNMGTIGGEWAVMDLLRGMYTGYDYINNIPENYFEDYLERIEEFVVIKEGNLDRNKSTEWSRLMLTLSSLGYDVRSVGEGHIDSPEDGYDFIERLSDSFKFSTRQGINGPIWEIIAMNTGSYKFEEQAENEDVNTFGKMINEILNREINKGEDNAGGWHLRTGNEIADADITGMALQALAPYYLDSSLYEEIKDDKSPSYKEFASAVERAIYTLTELQLENGGYDEWGTINSESISQVVVALTALDINPLSTNVKLKHIGKNVSFITAGGDRDGIETNNMIDALLTFWAPGSGETSPEVGGFRHITAGNDGGGNSGTSVNGMATEQSLYALVAYDRFLEKDNGINSLYDMSDMVSGEYKTLMSDRAMKNKSKTLEYKVDGKTIKESESPYAAIELSIGEDLEDKVFKDWNTKSDGSGTSYKTGEYLSMPNKDIVLYAQYSYNIERVSGLNRVQTSIATSKLAYREGSKTVVLAGYAGEVDALTGTLLANDKEAPLLLTQKDKISKGIEAELVRLDPKEIIILGGHKIISKEVEDKLKKNYTVKRVFGDKRAETAVEVAKEVIGENTDHIFLALGYDNKLADALAVGPASAKDKSPVLLTQTDMIPSTTKKAIEDLGVKEVTIVGGNKAVSKKVEEELAGLEINRIDGRRREETALKIAEEYFPESKTSILASGWDYADALVGGYYGAMMDSPILLTKTKTLSSKTKNYIKDHFNKIYVLGGEKVINNSVINQIEITK